MKIIGLQAQNIKRLRAVELTPEGHVITVGGRNGQGKTTLLDTVQYGFGGERAICDEPLRRGEKKGFLRLALDGIGLVITRTFTAGRKSKLVVTSADGKKKYTSPQAILDKLAGALTFDPEAFTRMDRHRQAETLRQLVGLDFTEIDARRRALFEERTGVNLDMKRLDGRIASLPHYDDAPAKRVNVADLVASLEEAEGANRQVDAATANVGDIKGRIAKQEGKIQHAETQIDAWRKQKDAAAEAIRVASEQLATAEAMASTAAEARVDSAAIRERIASAEQANEKVRANAERAEADLELKAVAAKAENLSDQLDAIDAGKAKALAEAKFPVPGLSFDDEQVFLADLPFEQAASSEKIRVSVAIAAAMNPELRVILIRNGSLLDADNRKLLADFAADHDYQLWIEINDPGKCSVVIEDGMVKEPASDGEAPAKPAAEPEPEVAAVEGKD